MQVDINTLQMIAGGSYQPTVQEVQEMAAELANYRMAATVRYGSAPGSRTTLVYGKL